MVYEIHPRRHCEYGVNTCVVTGGAGFLGSHLCERLLAEGDKVKLSVMFRGRELSHPEVGREVLDKVRELDPDVLWSTIGLVPQRPYLFSGTVASNLRYGDAEAVVHHDRRVSFAGLLDVSCRLAAGFRARGILFSALAAGLLAIACCTVLR